MANEMPCGRCGHLLEDVGSQNVPAGKRGHDATGSRIWDTGLA